MDAAYGNESKRIEKTNAERYQLAGQYGWQFWPEVPELLRRWGVMPFTQQGDKRIAFGVLSGLFQGMPFTVFEYHRRPTVTSYHTRWTGKKVGEFDTITIDSVWAVTLPAPMPRFQIVSSIEPTFDIDQYPEPPTHDPKFNRWYKVIDTDPNTAMQVLTPPVMATMRQLKVHNWSLAGNELVYVEHVIFGRTKPDDIVETLGKLYSLVSQLQYPQPQYQPPRYGYPQPGYPQPYPQPGYPPQGYPPR